MTEGRGNVTPLSDKVADEPIESINSVVLVKDLPGAHENPNVPRSIFLDELSEASVNAQEYVSVGDNVHKPGKGFQSKSVSVKAIQMKHGFDANGETGNENDWLVYIGKRWIVVRDGEL